MTGATADFANRPGRSKRMEGTFDPGTSSHEGPASLLIDGDNNTASGRSRRRATHRKGSRSCDSKSARLPVGTQLKILLRMDHGDASNGRGSTFSAAAG